MRIAEKLSRVLLDEKRDRPQGLQVLSLHCSGDLKKLYKDFIDTRFALKARDLLPKSPETSGDLAYGC